MVVLKVVQLLPWRAEARRHVKAAVVVGAHDGQHLFVAARHGCLVTEVGHDKHGLEVEHL
jgi:hypothetical protein